MFYNPPDNIEIYRIITQETSTVSDKPGVGVEINEEGLRKYAVVPFFE